MNEKITPCAITNFCHSIYCISHKKWQTFANDYSICFVYKDENASGLPIKWNIEYMGT